MGKILLVIFLVLIGIGILIFSILFPLLYVDTKYKKFVLNHSNGIKELRKINERYVFNYIDYLEMKNSYDNEKYYETISCQDYLTYQLVTVQKGVFSAINKTKENKIMFDKYNSEIKEKCPLNSFDTEETPRNKERLSQIEKREFGFLTKKPVIKFFIHVYLELTNINGYYQSSKYEDFSVEEIKSIVGKVNNKRGNYYLDKNIWDSICRVERGKVTNKMRFAIYERDGYRCKICGRATNDLEIDHIIPISRGGKSTYDNLQTLCHNCNKRKGSN